MKALLVLLFVGMTYAGPFKVVEHKQLGESTLSFLFFDVYKATLWAPSNTKLYESDLGLELKYHMSFSQDQFVEQTLKELSHIGVTNEKEWKPILKSIFVDISKGDSLYAKYVNGEGLYLYHNRKNLVGRITDSKKAQDFLNIWLSEKTSRPELRTGLLGIN